MLQNTINGGPGYGLKNFHPRLRKREANPKSILDVLVLDSSDLLLLLQRNPNENTKNTPGQMKLDDKKRSGNDIMENKEDTLDVKF